MHSYSLLARAKINLYLEIIGDRSDGYHELVMVLQTIDLADRVDVRANGTDTIRLHCEHPEVPLDASNLAYKAALLMCKQFPDAYAQYGGMEILIDKQIPVAAGLAGGSTDASAVLVAINLLWQLGLTQPELQALAAQLGSDTSFCISGGTALATGRGEQLNALNGLDEIAVVLAKHRNLQVSTAWAYETYREQFGKEYAKDLESIEARASQVHSGPLVSAIAHKDNAKIGQLLYNDLEKVVLPTYPQVDQLRTAFKREGVLGSLMSGSGPTVFALCKSQAQAQQVRQAVQTQLNDPEIDFWVTQLSSAGIEVA